MLAKAEGLEAAAQRGLADSSAIADCHLCVAMKWAYVRTARRELGLLMKQASAQLLARFQEGR